MEHFEAASLNGNRSETPLRKKGPLKPWPTAGLGFLLSWTTLLGSCGSGQLRSDDRAWTHRDRSTAQLQAREHGFVQGEGGWGEGQDQGLENRRYGFWFHGKNSDQPKFLDPSLRLVTSDHVLEVYRGDNWRTSRGVPEDEGFSASPSTLPIEWRSLPPGSRWVVVELWGEGTGRLRGEVDRWGPLALVELPASAVAHEWLGSHVFHVSELESFEGELTHQTRVFNPVAQEAGESLRFMGTPDQGGEFTVIQQKLGEFSGELTLEGGERIKERASDQGRQRARDWMRQELERLGYRVSEHVYRGRFSEGVNLIADRLGKETGKTLIISSHYDSVGNAGADDNGAGVVGMMALAEKLKGKELGFPLRLVFFDQEENGLIGSKAYVDYLKEQGQLNGIRGNINFEMIGYDSNNDGAIHIIDCNENTSAQLTSRVMASLTARPTLSLHRVAACTNRSDHASFWRYGLPAIVVSENFFGGDGNPCYHKTCDEARRIHWSYMTRIVDLMAGMILEWKEPNPS